MKNNISKHSKLAFLVGLAFCNNIIYVFKYNSFFLNISNVVSICVFIYFMIYEKDKFLGALKKIDKFFILFIFFSLFSIIPAAIYFSDNDNLISAYFNGLPNLLLLFVEYYIIILLSDEQKYIMNGIMYGFIINIIYSIIQFVLYKFGKICTLYYIFPNASFQVSGYYEYLSRMSDIQSTLKIYFFRAQGLFLETSYFIVFVTTSILIFYTRINNRLIKGCFLFFTFFLCLISESGNFALVFASFVLYYLLFYVKTHRKKISFKKVAILNVFCVTCIALIFIILNPEIFEKIEKTIQSTNIFDISNGPRARTILEGIELIKKYPLGVGYNMASKVFNYEFPEDSQNYIFSTLIVNELELGILGNIIYIIFSVKSFLFLLQKSTEKEDLAIGVSAFMVFICQVSNGINYWNIEKS